MNRYFIQLSYNGSQYHGWQIQDNANTVQAEINSKISLLLGEEINVLGCGRTDTGVHARDFYAHFDIETEIDDCVDLKYKLDKFLANDIRIVRIWKVSSDLHSRFSALSRTYSYYITREKDPFRLDSCYYYHGPLSLSNMQKSCQYLFDYNDFTSFSKLNTQTATNDCQIFEANWEQVENKMIFTVRANRFLRNMVRAIVGTMMEIGKGKFSFEDMKRIIEAKDRGQAGFSVPAQGLFLESVEYDFDKFEDK